MAGALRYVVTHVPSQVALRSLIADRGCYMVNNPYIEITSACAKLVAEITTVSMSSPLDCIYPRCFYSQDRIGQDRVGGSGSDSIVKSGQSSLQ